VQKAYILYCCLTLSLFIVFVFVLALSLLKASLIPIMLMPGSFNCIAWQRDIPAMRAHTQETSVFVLCHNLLAAKRAKLFLLLLS